LEPVERPLESDEDDPQLLLHVEFTGSVRLKALTVIGGDGGRSPSELKVFVNRDDLDFGAVEGMEPVQRWDLVENLNGTMEYPVKYAMRGVECASSVEGVFFFYFFSFFLLLLFVGVVGVVVHIVCCCCCYRWLLL